MKLIINICDKDQYTDIPGVHLNEPDQFYLDQAINDSISKGHSLIFCHYETAGTAKYKIPYDVLGRLVSLNKKAFKIVFTHPCT